MLRAIPQEVKGRGELLNSPVSRSLLKIADSENFKEILKERNSATHPDHMDTMSIDSLISKMSKFHVREREQKLFDRAKTIFTALKQVPQFEKILKAFNDAYKNKY